MSQKKHHHFKKTSGTNEKDIIPYSLYKEVFLEFQQELDSKYDKHERLVKLSRDCTIRSKRVIFVLHRITGNEISRDSILAEAKGKIKDEILGLLQAIAEEIAGEDPKKHHSAFSPGLQEFIEALSYMTFLSNGCLIAMEDVQSYLTFRIHNEDSAATKGEAAAEGEAATKGEQTEMVSDNVICLPLEPMDYLLGIADLTGELMRLCINSVGCGDKELPFNLLPFFRAMHCGFLSLRSLNKEMGRKTSVLKNSLHKVEKVCYTLKIRGSEIPDHMLIRMITNQTDTDNNAEDDQF